MKRSFFKSRTIFLKFLLAYVLFAFFGFLAVTTFIRSLTVNYVLNDRAEKLYRIAVQIADTYAADLYDTKTSIESVFSELKVLSAYTGADIWLINPSGRLVLDTSRTITSEDNISLTDFDPTITGGSYYTTGDFFGAFEDETLSVFAPITAGYKVRAYVVMHSAMQSIQSSADGYMSICYMVMLVLLLLSLIIIIFFSEMVYVPIKRISEAAEQYAAGNMDYRVPVESDDEIGYLAATLSYMAGEIAGTEEERRKFIANVSHDFRSPLTSIRGYIEAMLDGTIKKDDSERYLNIVLNETERLTKLTNGLLTLNNVSNGEIRPDIVSFDINRVIRDTAASFEGSCRLKKITIDLILTDDTMEVDADEERIKQVLYNLLDNAIKFSHMNGIITIETTEKGDKVYVSVRDTGIGIPENELQLIFDRFYKTDASRGKDKTGTGLGLSIVKEIIKAHDETIEVRSKENEGTEFIFSLKTSPSMDDE